MVRLRALGKILAYLLLILLLLSPLLQIYFPMGVMTTRDSIAGWSYGLAQIAFGLVAAFVIFLLPQIVEISRLNTRWNQVLHYYKETEKFNRDAVFSDFRKALEANSTSNPPPNYYSERTEQWVAEQKSRPANQPMTTEEVEKSINLLTRELKDLIVSREQWTLMVEKSTTAIHYSWQSSAMRRFLFAAYSSRELELKLRKLIILLVALILISVLFGFLALSPDPFLYIWLKEVITGRVIFRSEPNYPEMSLWVTACVYLANIFCLTFWFAVETRAVHVHDTDAFEEITP